MLILLSKKKIDRSPEPKPVAIPSWTFAPSKHRLTIKVRDRNSFPFAIPWPGCRIYVQSAFGRERPAERSVFCGEKPLFHIHFSQRFFTSVPHPARVSMHHQSPPNRRREGYFPLQFVELSSASSPSWDNKSHLARDQFSTRKGKIRNLVIQSDLFGMVK